jgi:hypothetical protein
MLGDKRIAKKGDPSLDLLIVIRLESQVAFRIQPHGAIVEIS